MSLLDLLRKGLGYVLMSLGASSPDAAKKAAPRPGPKPPSDAGKAQQDEDSESKGSGDG